MTDISAQRGAKQKAPTNAAGAKDFRQEKMRPFQAF